MRKQVSTVVFMRQLKPLALTFVAGLALLANLGMASAPRPMSPNGSTTVSGVVLGDTLTLRTSSAFAGAIVSLLWRGQEFINQDDHGRELQSAVSFNGLGECFNPTEAGSGRDGNQNQTTSRLLSLQAGLHDLKTSTKMAFWTSPGDLYPNGCGGNPSLTTAQNTTAVSGVILDKHVTIGFKEVENAIEYFVTYHVPDPLDPSLALPHGPAVFEALTGYMPKTFQKFMTFDPAHQILSDLSHEAGEQGLPIIFATDDQKYAMGIYSPDLPQQQFAQVGYGRFDFSQIGNTTKWNAVFRTKKTPAGTYSFRMYVLVGTVDDVKTGITKIARSFNSGSDRKLQLSLVF